MILVKTALFVLARTGEVGFAQKHGNSGVWAGFVLFLIGIRNNVALRFATLTAAMRSDESCRVHHFQAVAVRNRPFRL